MCKSRLAFQEIETGLPPSLHGDPIRLKQVLINLTKYVLKNSDSRDIKIKASYEGEEGEDSGQLTVLICDKGTGLNQQEIQSSLDGSK